MRGFSFLCRISEICSGLWYEAARQAEFASLTERHKRKKRYGCFPLRRDWRKSAHPTDPPNPEARREAAASLIQMLQNQGVWVAESLQLHEHFAVIDRQVVWYSSANLLSRPREEDDMIRLMDSEVADLLLTAVEEKREDNSSYRMMGDTVNANA